MKNSIKIMAAAAMIYVFMAFISSALMPMDMHPFIKCIGVFMFIFVTAIILENE